MLQMLRFLARMSPRWLAPERARYWRPGFWAKCNSIHFEPVGTILIIGPPGFPFSIPVMQACAALLCGNCVILIQSEFCPMSTSLIRELFAEALLPIGALEVVEGPGEIVEEWIARPQIQKIVFTGSCEAGRRVAAACGRYFKPCILELGGGSSAIVCRDADLSLAARGIAWSVSFANGRSFAGIKRVFVCAEVKKAFLTLLRQSIHAIRTGDPSNPETDLSQITGKAGDLVNDALAKGAQLWSPTGLISEEDSHFQAPLIIDSASPEMRFMHEEIAFPLVAVREVMGDEQALREANQSSSGLGASIWSRNIRKARAMAHRLDAGTVWINDSSVGLPPLPWGGRKQSGWGRMFSRYGLLELTHVKVISSERARLSLSKMWWFPYARKRFEIFKLFRQGYWRTRSSQVLNGLMSVLRGRKAEEQRKHEKK